VASLLTQMQIASVRNANPQQYWVWVYTTTLHEGFYPYTFFFGGGGDTPPTSEIPPRNFWPGL